MKRLIASLTLMGSIAGYAQFAWIQVAPTFTENLEGVAFPTPTHGFVCGSRMLLMETFNGGQTWRFRSGVGPLTSDIPPFYAVQFFDAQHGWITGSNNNAYRSTDGGVTWSRMLTVPAGSWWHIDFLSSTTGFIGANGACAFTSNGGQTWQVRSGYPNCPVMYGMDFRDANIGLVAGNQLSGGGTGIYRTTDGGRTWSKQLSGSFNDVIFLDNNTALVAGSDGSIYRSNDAGISWTQIAPTRPNGIGNLARVDSLTIVAVSLLGDIWRSADGGFSWTLVHEGLGVLPETWNVYFRDSQNGWVAGPGGILLASSDGGQTWQLLGNGVADDILGIRLASRTHGYAVTRNAYVLRTQDGGRRWQAQHLQVTGTVFGRIEGLNAIDALDAQFAVAAGNVGIAFKTEDGGQTWQSIGYPALPGDFAIMDVCFTSRQTGWVVGLDNDLGHYRNIYRTTDGGLSWQLVVPVQEAVIYNAVDFVGNSGWIVGPRTYLLCTQDGGDTWQQIALPYGSVTNLQFNDVDFATEQVGWMIGTLGYVLRTTNGGRTWQPQNLGVSDDLTALYVVDANEAWVCTIRGEVFHTTNGGQTWDRENTGYPSNMALLALHGAGGQIAAGGSRGLLFMRQPAEAIRVSAFSVPVGARLSGGLIALRASDDLSMLLESRTPSQSGNPHAQLVVEGTATTLNPSRLLFRIEARTNASPAISVKQVLDLFNFTTNQWEIREERLADVVFDATVETTVYEHPEQYIQAGTGRVRARMSWYKVGDLVSEPWAIWIDYAQWTLLPVPINGDVDGNGCVDDADLLAVLFTFGCNASCGSEDVNGDGIVDDADLLIVLFNFGTGC